MLKPLDTERRAQLAREHIAMMTDSREASIKLYEDIMAEQVRDEWIVVQSGTPIWAIRKDGDKVTSCAARYATRFHDEASARALALRVFNGNGEGCRAERLSTALAQTIVEQENTIATLAATLEEIEGEQA